MRREIAHEQSGSLPIIANPLRFSKTPVEDYIAPPEIGEHGDAILTQLLDYDSQQLASLRGVGVLG
jgi:crotonobetainyl-CoA:carnitine CoA-transferase CaiB-like acyl-CoA transferase